MAGTYGHEVKNFERSKKLFDISWKQPIESQQHENVLVTGFSCRSKSNDLQVLEVDILLKCC